MVAEGRAKITLDGSQFTSELNTASDKAKKFEGDLVGVGQSGSREFDNLQKGAMSLGKSVNDVSGDFKRYEKAGIDANRNIGAQKDSLMGKLKAIGPAVVAAYAIKKIAEFGQQMMKAADEVDNLSKRLDASNETVQSLGIIAKEAGLSMSDMENAMLKTSRASIEARAGNNKLQEAFSKLGITAGDLASMNNEQIFERVTKAMADNRNNADVLSAAYDVIGTRSAPRLQSTLIDIGEKGFAKINKEMRDSNQIMSNETIGTWNQLNDELAKGVRQLQAWAGEYGGKFIASIKTGAEWLGVVTAGGNWDEYKASLEAVNEQQEKLNKKTREKAAADEAIKEAQEAQAALAAEIADLEGKLKTTAEDRRTIEQKIADTKKEIDALLQSERGMTDMTRSNYRNQLQVQVQIKGKREELAALEATAAAAQAAADKVRERAANQMLSLQQQLAQRETQLAESRMTKEELLQVRITQRDTLLQNIARIEEAANGRTEESIRLRLDLLNVERDIEQMQPQKVEKQTKIRDLNKEQLALVEQYRDVFRGMNEREINEMLSGLRHLATELAKLPEVANLGWIDQIASLRFAGVSGGQARQMVRALTDLIEGLATLPDLPADKLTFLESLGNFRFTGITSGQARQMARAIAALVEGIKDVDVGNLKEIGDALGKIGMMMPGKYEVDIKVDGKIPESIPLMIPESLTYNLGKIEGHLGTLANLKGVVWA